MENIQPLAIDGVELSKPIIISGPCSAETEEQVLETATQLARKGVKIYRAGIWKPRTKPGGFEGVGVPGLAWLNKVRKETGMKISTEVANRSHVEAALEYDLDLLWIGARTSANPFAMQEIADVLRESGRDIPVLVKNPVNPDLELWIGALERLYNAGITPPRCDPSRILYIWRTHLPQPSPVAHSSRTPHPLSADPHHL